MVISKGMIRQGFLEGEPIAAQVGDVLKGQRQTKEAFSRGHLRFKNGKFISKDVS